jgi:hypothetical protein
MKILRQSDSEILIEDSSLLFSLRKSTFLFSKPLQSIQWTLRRDFRKETGNVAFSEVQDIVIEKKNPGDTTQPCRLSLRTAKAAIPVSVGYNLQQDQASTLRATLLAFAKATAGAKPASATYMINTDALRTQQLNDSIRTLLNQGKKIDAILLVQRSEHLDLTEATFRVNQVANQMGPKQPAAKA